MNTLEPAEVVEVASLADAVRLLDGSALQLREEACVNLRARVPFCHACTDACPSGALQPGSDEVELDDDRCTGCGACLPACPAGVFSLPVFDPARFLDSFRAEPVVHLHCSRSDAGGGGVVLPCFRVLDARLVAAAAGRGVRRFVLHGLQHCEGCERGSANEWIAEVCGRLQQWFGGAGPRLESDTEGAQASGALRHLDRPVMGRRSFVRLGGRQGAARVVSWLLPAAAAVESWDPGDTAPFHRPADFEQAPHPYQAVFTAAVTALPWKSATTLPFRVREIDDACTTCLACGQRCPTGALAASEAVGERGLFFDRARCTDCGLCERLCPHGAISTRAPTSITEIGNGRAPPLLRAARPCRRCAQQTEVARLVDGVCPQCDNEQGMDEQWMAMLDG